MKSIISAILSKEFGKFLPGFHGTEFLVFICVVSFVLSQHPNVSLLSLLIGGFIGLLLLPRVFVRLAKRGVLGPNWDKNGLVNNPYD